MGPLAQRQKQVELLREEGVVILGGEPEERVGLAEGAAPTTISARPLAIRSRVANS